MFIFSLNVLHNRKQFYHQQQVQSICEFSFLTRNTFLRILCDLIKAETICFKSSSILAGEINEFEHALAF